MGVRLEVADLDLAARECEAALEVSQEYRHIEWASGRCVNTRFVHKHIWKSRPRKDYVKSKIIPLLKTTRDAIIAIRFDNYKQDEKERLVVYARNIALRIVNLEENYLLDRPSDFAPDDRLEKVEKEIWEKVKAP